MMRPWTSVALLAVSALLVQPPSAQAMPDPAHLIVPGKAIGPVALGASLGDLKARLGPPDDVRPLDREHSLLQWREYALVVGIEADRVVLVGTHSGQYQTSTGLRVGVPKSLALTLFPALTPPAVTGLVGLADDVMGINFLHRPADEPDPPLKNARPSDDWVIDEINVYRSINDLDRRDAPAP